ncbi:unnamed protein product [Pleuronectes platessa]|uniref:Uncharacterized protein n=1 Tax=Pleuronectes platessa TaxID=8262 RepID=A0A9N7V8D3_PLEPL|nr:unnamed protein product [Pleuronectes platessa]
MGQSRELELPKITVKTIRPHFDDVINHLTAEDWRQLKLEKVKSSLGDALRSALDRSTNSATLDQFTELVAEEVTERINASLHSHSTSKQSNGPPRCHHTTPDKVEKMGRTTSTSSDSDSTSHSHYSDSASSSRSTVRSSDSGESEAVEEIFMKEFGDIMDLLVDEMDESDLKTPNSQKSPKGFWKGVGQKIRKLFAKVFATASMLKMGTEVRKKFSKGTQIQSSESVKSLMDSVGSLLLTETKNRVSPENAPVLSNVLYRHITNDSSEASPVDVTKVSVPKSHRKMYADIKERVTNSLPLMNWWFSKEAGDYTKRVTSALMEIESIGVSRVSEIDAAKEREESRKKIYLSLLIDQLVTRVYSKSRVIFLPCRTKRRLSKPL